MKQLLFFILLTPFLSIAQTSDDRKSTNNNEAFVATSDPVAVTAGIAATFHDIFIISNPVGSGANIHIDYFKFLMNGANLMIPTSSWIFVNPNTVTTYAARKNNRKIGSTVTDNTTVFGYNFSSTGLTSTISSPYEIPQNSGDKFGDGNLELMEGQSLGIDLSKSVGLGVALSSGVIMCYYHKIPN